jgi:hypothetical protein
MAYEPTLVNYDSMDFKIETGATTILFRDYTSQAILETYPANSLAAVANGAAIRIQFTGGEKTLVQALDSATIKIDGVLLVGNQAANINSLNALFANAGGGDAPTITSSASVLLTVGNTMNYQLTGTNVVTYSWDTLITEIVTIEGDHSRVIGGSGLAAGVYTIVGRVTNYHGTAIITVTITVSAAFTNTYSFYGGLSATTKQFLIDSALSSQTASPLFRTSNTTGAAADVTKAWSVSFWHKSQQTSGYGKGPIFGAGYSAENSAPSQSSGFDITIKGGATNTEVYIYYGSNWYRTEMGYNDTGTNMQDWKHVVVTYSGGDTATTNPVSEYAPFNVYIDGAAVTRTFEYTKLNGWSGKIAAVNNSGTWARYYDVRMLVSKWSTAYHPSTKVNVDEMGFYGYELSPSEVSLIWHLGVPISLNNIAGITNPLDYFRIGDGVDPSNPSNTDLLNFPIMYNFYASRFNMDATNMTVADYLSDTP